MPDHSPNHASGPSPSTNPGAVQPSSRPESRPLNFVEQIAEADAASGRWGVWTELNTGTTRDCRTPAGPGEGVAAKVRRFGRPRVHTRFPPEPNGYLHIGHAKSIWVNYGLALKHDGKFNLRFDDTNPVKEEQEYVDAIIRDVRWLGAEFDPRTGAHGGGLYLASDYFDLMYAFAEELVKKGKAYVCDLTGDEVSARRGKPGVPATSPFRDRSADENLALLRDMRAGKFPNGAKTLRAKIDLASPNFNMRDPVLYRIVHEEHHNTGAAWCIYPMYDWAHGFEDSVEGITHSICTLEFEDHRPLYEWFIDAVNEGRTDDGSGPWGRKIHRPQQIEFAKFRPTYTVLSKRNLLKMVQDGTVKGWDDPRMPTLSGLRRRGYTPGSLRTLCEDVGLTKVESSIDIVRVENAIRDDLNATAPRAMAVLNPLKIIIENLPEGFEEQLDAANNPENSGAGGRKVPFSREIYIERDDFLEAPPPKFFRLSPGAEVRLRWAYFLTCTAVVKDAAGHITELRATIDPATRGGDAPAGPDGKPSRRVQGTIHWVSARHAVPAEVRLYDRLFKAEEPGKATGNWADDLNPDSLRVVRALLEPSLASLRYRRGVENGADAGDRVQFERLGYFCVDQDSGTAFGGSGPGDMLVLNRTVTLKDSWSAQASDATGKPVAKVGPRMYDLPEAARELKIKADKMPALIGLAGVAGFEARTPPMLTIDEVRGLKQWLKTNPGRL